MSHATEKKTDQKKTKQPMWDGTKPWHALRSRITAGDAEGVHEVLEFLTPGQVARAMTRLDGEETQALLTLLEPEEAADLVEELPDAQGADIIEELPANQAAAIVDEMDSDQRVDLLGEMDQDDAEAILSAMDPEEAEDARHLLEYEEDSVGGAMVSEFLSYPQDTPVADVLAAIQENAEHYSDEDLLYVYVESGRGTLIGVARLRDLVLSRAGLTLQDIMIVNPVYVLADMKLEELGHLFDRYTFRDVPVTNADGKLVGVARRGDVEEALGEAQERNFLRFTGIVGGEELRSMPVYERATRRLAWLGPNLVLSFAAAIVILLFEDTITTFGSVLVLFIPVIGNMCGCTGNQAVAVSIREMALGLVQPSDFMRVWLKELPVGLVNGCILGTAIGGAAFALGHFFPDKAPPILGLFIGAAFLVNTVISVSLGGLIPLFLRMLGLDPALGSPPLLTTLSDMIGLLLMFGMVYFANEFGWLA